MKAIVPFAAALAAFLCVAASAAANSAEANVKGANPISACGSPEKNTCRGKCYYQYEQFICGDPKPGQIGKHKKELKECYQSCKAAK
jgi:hypothetical protein